MNQKVKSTVEALKEWLWSSEFNIQPSWWRVCGSLARHKILTGSRVRDDEGNTLPCHTLSTKISKRKNKSLLKPSLMKKGRRNKTKKTSLSGRTSRKFWILLSHPRKKNGNTADWLPREPFIIYTWRFRVKQWYLFLCGNLVIDRNLFEEESFQVSRKSFRQRSKSKGMSRPKRAVSGRISVHTFDVVDELLEDNDKHELAKVKIK